MGLRILVLFLLVSCGSSKKDVYDNPDGVAPGGPTDSEFAHYIEEFEDDTGTSVSHIPIQMGELKDSAAGVCYRWGSGEVKIVIDREVWEYVDHVTKHFLIWHELGHCGFKLGHFDGRKEDGCPKSIMNYIYKKTN